jgi:hypothetical protein
MLDPYPFSLFANPRAGVPDTMVLARERLSTGS